MDGFLKKCLRHHQPATNLVTQVEHTLILNRIIVIHCSMLRHVWILDPQWFKQIQTYLKSASIWTSQLKIIANCMPKRTLWQKHAEIHTMALLWMVGQTPRRTPRMCYKGRSSTTFTNDWIYDMTCDKICPPHAPVWSADWDVLSLSLLSLQDIEEWWRVRCQGIVRYQYLPIVDLSTEYHISHTYLIWNATNIINRCTEKSDLSSDLYTFGSVLLFFYGTLSCRVK